VKVKKKKKVYIPGEDYKKLKEMRKNKTVALMVRSLYKNFLFQFS